MIGKSDLIILGVATVALTIGVGRWYSNTQSVSAVTIPASARSSIEADRDARDGRNKYTGFVHVVGERDRAGRQPAATTDAREKVASYKAPDKVAEQSGATTNASAKQVAPKRDAPRYGVYTVKSGDYLQLIANRYDTSVGELQALNQLSGTVIRVGQELRYPQGDG